jgi:hypothetical protein
MNILTELTFPSNLCYTVVTMRRKSAAKRDALDILLIVGKLQHLQWCSRQEEDVHRFAVLPLRQALDSALDFVIRLLRSCS